MHGRLNAVSFETATMCFVIYILFCEHSCNREDFDVGSPLGQRKIARQMNE